jgi:hypothetical protein
LHLQKKILDAGFLFTLSCSRFVPEGRFHEASRKRSGMRWLRVSLRTRHSIRRGCRAAPCGEQAQRDCQGTTNPPSASGKQKSAAAERRKARVSRQRGAHPSADYGSAMRRSAPLAAARAEKAREDRRRPRLDKKQGRRSVGCLMVSWLTIDSITARSRLPEARAQAQARKATAGARAIHSSRPALTRGHLRMTGRCARTAPGARNEPIAWKHSIAHRRPTPARPPVRAFAAAPPRSAACREKPCRPRRAGASRRPSRRTDRAVRRLAD